MPTRDNQDLDKLVVVDGKILRETPPETLDVMITRLTQRLVRLDEQIAAIQAEKAKVQVRLNRVIAIRAQL